MKNSKKVFYIVICMVILVIGIYLFAGDNDEVSASAETDYEYSYYVENSSVISKIAFICDDCCYYLVDIVLGGIESVFSKIIA